MDNTPSPTKTNLPVTFNENTGLAVQSSFQAKSGFNYLLGVREMEGIYILEEVADGIGCTFLCGIKIVSKEDKTLIKEIEVKQGVRYSRKKSSELVQEGLIEILHESAAKEGIQYSKQAAITAIEKLLDKCYYEKSRTAMLDWAYSIGLI